MATTTTAPTRAERRAQLDRQQSDFYHPSVEATPEMQEKRNPLTWHLRKPMEGPRSLAIKNHFIAMVGEYVGTTLFLLFALGGTNVANMPTTSVTGSTAAGQDGSQAATANTSNLLYISLCFGFSLAVNVWIFFRVSGGLFNPAVSLAMVLVGALEPLRGALLTVSQILGGITGAALVQVLTPGTLNVRTELGGGTSIAQGLFIEMFLTSLLMLAILLLAAEKHKATFIAPVGIGLALFVAELLGVYYTGGSLNPARSFGPAVVLRTFSNYHWIYWLGPVLGSTLAAGFYKMLKWLQYETVLGEEEATRPSTPMPSSNEKTTAANGAGAGTMAIQGPGMDGYLTTGRGNPGDDNVGASAPAPTSTSTSTSTSASAPAAAGVRATIEGEPPLTEQAWHLGAGPERLESRLDKIEELLAQLVSSDSGRISTSTTVNGGASLHKMGDGIASADYGHHTKVSDQSQV